MTVLKNVVPFTGLLVGVPTSRPHGINVNGAAALPQYVAANDGGFTITADTINITVTRTTGPAAVNVYAEHWHTVESVTPPGNLAGLVPFVAGAGSGGGGTLLPVVVAPLGDFVPTANRTNVIPTGQTGPLTATMPLAASVPNGTLLAIVMFTSDPTGLDVVPSGGDKTNNAADGVPFLGQNVITMWVSDGATNWWQVSRFEG